MKIKLNIFLIIFLLMHNGDSYAQQVKHDGIFTYIDCSTLPLKAIRTLPIVDHTEDQNINKVARKYIVANKNATYNGVGNMNWANAKRACESFYQNSTSEIGTWRLPTQREIMLIMMLHPKLESQVGFVKFERNRAYYWSSTMYSLNAGDVWNATFSEDNYSRYTKNSDTSIYVRCVRDY